MNLQQEVKCDLPGMADVVVTYNLMATARQVDAFREEATADTAKPVIVKIQRRMLAEEVIGSKADTKATESLFGGDPYSEDQPIAWSLWLRWHGWRKAMGQFLTDPN